MGNPSENRYLSEHSQLLKHTSSRAKRTRVIFFYKQSMLFNIFIKDLTLTSQESLEVAPSTVQDLLRLCNPPCLPAVHKAEGLSPCPAIPSTHWGSCAHTQCCRCCHEPSSWGSWCDPNSMVTFSFQGNTCCVHSNLPMYGVLWDANCLQMKLRAER